MVDRQTGAVQLGFQITRGTGRGGRYFEIDSIPQSLLDRWSSRHHQVRAAIRARLTAQERALQTLISEGGPEAEEAMVELERLHATGQLPPKQDRLMGTLTRSAKVPATTQDLDSEWQREAIRHRISRERLELLRLAPKTLLEAASPEEVLVALTEFDSTFAAREARAAALEQSAGTPILVALDQLRALRASGEILLLADGSGTTKDHRGYERAVIAITKKLAATTLEPIPHDVAVRETGRLDQELATHGGRLSGEQRQAIQLACGEHPLVVIVGHAGTGKSTTLTGIARAHQNAGRQIVVTSTAAAAAERLATELQQHGVVCMAFSTAGLHAALNHGRVELGPDTTVIHDEAALASTREQLRLLHAVETSGARLVAVGDPQQNQPVGAGGLWDRIENMSRQTDALVALTVNQRAQDPGDRHSQTLFRKGETELAIRTYAARDRIHQAENQRRVEDRALEAAHQDRASGKRTLVVAQTSNEHLDELNSRAQAIRKQHRQLGEHGLEIPGRPYELHEGDEIQVRHTINHPQHGPLRNGTNATVTAVDAERREVELRLADGARVRLDREQVEQADLRLAYVQHPFPAQGHTNDTTHVIITDQATREGTYVALTRARQQTHIYHAVDNHEPSAAADPLARLAERVSQTEPEVPSIDTPLAHETNVTASVELEADRERTVSVRRDEIEHEPNRTWSRHAKWDVLPPTGRDREPERDRALLDHDPQERSSERGRRALDTARQPSVPASSTERELEREPPRVWPGRAAAVPDGLERETEVLTRDRTLGHEL